MLCIGAHKGSLETRLAKSLHSVLALTKEPWNKASHELALQSGPHQGSMGTRLARDCTPYWCSSGEHGNKDSLHTCSQGEPGMRLAQGLYSVLVLTREPGKEASPGRELCTWAHQESLGTRLAMSLHSVLVLNRGAWEQG